MEQDGVMWEKIDAHWQKLVWGRKGRRNKRGEVILREARIDLRNDTTGEIVNLTATVTPEGDLEREIDLAVQRHLAGRAATVPTDPEVEDLRREIRRLEGELEAVSLKLTQTRDLAKVKAGTPGEASRGEPS